MDAFEGRSDVRGEIDALESSRTSVSPIQNCIAIFPRLRIGGRARSEPETMVAILPSRPAPIGGTLSHNSGPGLEPPRLDTR